MPAVLKKPLASLFISAKNTIINKDNFFSLKEGEYIIISFKDQGVGIPEQNISKIFDPYFTTKENVSGLGLATSYSIIKKHGGIILVESTPGNGSTFCVYLPAANKPLDEKKADEKIRLNFPLTESEPIEPDMALLKALGIQEYDKYVYSEVSQDLMIQLKDITSVENLSPDFDAMKRVETEKTIRGVIVTTKGEDNFDFVSRFFAPWAGINEDPVTGSAHTQLQPFWSKILGKNERIFAHKVAASV